MKRRIATVLALASLTLACATIGGALIGGGIGAIAGDSRMGAAVGATAGAVIDIFDGFGRHFGNESHRSHCNGENSGHGTETDNGDEEQCPHDLVD